MQAALAVVDGHLLRDSSLRTNFDAAVAERKRRAMPVLVVAVLLVLLAALVVFGGQAVRGG